MPVEPEGRLLTELISSDRLLLEPLCSGDADEMFLVLNNERLHDFTGGRPLTLTELRERYGLLAAQRSPDGREVWLNWIVRIRDNRAAVGTVQASIAGRRAQVAWVIGEPWQRGGYAKEAAKLLVFWLLEHGISKIVANVHPKHIASERVAAAAGLRPTNRIAEGEVVWSLTHASGRQAAILKRVRNRT